MSKRWENDRPIERSAGKQQKTGKSDSVSESIIRGRAALAEAENHIKMFEDYLRKSTKEDASHNYQIKKFITQEETPFSQSNVFSHEPFDSYNQEHSMIENGGILSDIDDSISMSLINEMIKEGERRQQRDNAITSARCEGNIFPRNKHDMIKKVKPTKKRNFDPQNLAVAKRAIVKTAITAEEIAQGEAEMKKKSQFKARPLPGGIFVKNDPYALTKAALGKVAKAVGDKSDSSTYPSQNTRLDASLLFNRPQSSSFSRTNTPKLRRNDRKHEIMKKAVYDQISETIVMSYDKDLDQSDEELSSQDDQDLASLHQQISKLQAELNIKRIQCIKTIEEIDKYCPETDLSNTIINSDGMRFPNANNDDCEQGQIHNKEICVLSQKHTPRCHKADKRKIGETKMEKKQDKSSSLYDRHFLWLQMREEKRMEAKVREEKELVKDVTGKPNLHGAKESWMKAKQQHDGLMKSIEMKDKLRKSEKDEKERQLREKHVHEIERLQLLAKEKNREGKCGIDKRKQSEYVDKLARPNSRLKVNSKVKVDDLSKAHLNENSHEKEEKASATAEKQRSTGVDLSFADMDDKEFSKMIKKLKAKASKGKRTTFGSQSNNDNCQNDISIEKNKDENDNTLDRSCINECDEDDKDGNRIEDGRFTSSIAQANIYAEISERNGEIHYDHDDKKPQTDTKIDEEGSLMIDKQKLSFPYERYDAGGIPFFDRSSSSDRGRFRVHDAREFHTDSLRRIHVPFDASSCDGVMFLVGKKKDQAKSPSEDVVTILFDRSKFDEKTAAAWWQLNRDQII